MAKFGGGLVCCLGALAILALACDAAGPRPGPVPQPQAPPQPSAGAFVERKGSQFVVDGSAFLFNGFNAYWMMSVAAVPANRMKVTETLGEAAAAGLTVCRTWAFNDGGEGALQVSPGVYNEQVFQGLDFVISEAGRCGFRLILSLVNNYGDLGGRPQYARWARSAGVVGATDDDFYTNPTVKGYYMNHIKTVLTRVNTITKIAYKDDATIMAWELINEPHCQADYSGKTVNAWVQEMATYTKSIDNRHMLEIGMEGLYGASTPDKIKLYNPNGYQIGTDFITSNLISEIDFATIHAYPDIWLPGQSDDAQTAFVQQWMWSHWDDAVKILDKPLVFSEFGKSTKDPGYSEKLRDAFLATVYNSIYNFSKAASGSFGGGLVWQLLAEGMGSYDDGYEIVLPQNPETGAMLKQQSQVMAALASSLRGPSGDATTTPASRGQLPTSGAYGRKHGR